MRYVIAASLVAVGAALLGLAIHDTVAQAWQVVSQ